MSFENSEEKDLELTEQSDASVEPADPTDEIVGSACRIEEIAEPGEPCAETHGEPVESAEGKRAPTPRSPFWLKVIFAIMLSVVSPLTVCVFGPFEIYSANLDEFKFSLMDFLPYTMLFALGAAVIIFAFLIVLAVISHKSGKDIFFNIGCGAMLWISLMLFVQRNYLNLFMGGGGLAGDGSGAQGIDWTMLILNTAIWAVAGCIIVFGIVFLSKKFADIKNAIVIVSVVALVGMQVVNFGINTFTTETFTPILEREKKEGEGETLPSKLNYDQMGELSDGKNIVFFLVDRFDANYYDTMVKKNPGFFDRLDGFTHFNDYTSLYARTFPSVASILTGKDHDYFSGKSKAQALYSFYSDGCGKLGVLKENGYKINLYAEEGYDYVDASVLSGYAQNVSGGVEYHIDNSFSLAKDMLLLSLSQYLPMAATAPWSNMLSTPLFNDHAIYETNDGEMFMVSTDATIDLTNRLKNDGFAKVESEGQFTFIHLYGCHDTANSTTKNLTVTFELIYYYLDQMKEMGLYEDATIVITGDHAAALSDSKMIGSANKYDDGTRVTAMLFKKSGDSGTPLATSSAQISQDELWDTIFESEGLLDLKSGESFFDIPEGVDRERRYFFEMYRNSKNNGNKYNKVYEYKIVGNANVGESWKIVSETDIVK